MKTSTSSTNELLRTKIVNCAGMKLLWFVLAEHFIPVVTISIEHINATNFLISYAYTTLLTDMIEQVSEPRFFLGK